MDSEIMKNINDWFYRIDKIPECYVLANGRRDKWTDKSGLRSLVRGRAINLPCLYSSLCTLLVMILE